MQQQPLPVGRKSRTLFPVENSKQHPALDRIWTMWGRHPWHLRPQHPLPPLLQHKLLCRLQQLLLLLPPLCRLQQHPWALDNFPMLFCKHKLLQVNHRQHKAVVSFHPCHNWWREEVPTSLLLSQRPSSQRRLLPTQTTTILLATDCP